MCFYEICYSVVAQLTVNVHGNVQTWRVLCTLCLHRLRRLQIPVLRIRKTQTVKKWSWFWGRAISELIKGQWRCRFGTAGKCSLFEMTLFLTRHTVTALLHISSEAFCLASTHTGLRWRLQTGASPFLPLYCIGLLRAQTKSKSIQSIYYLASLDSFPYVHVAYKFGRWGLVRQPTRNDRDAIIRDYRHTA